MLTLLYFQVIDIGKISSQKSISSSSLSYIYIYIYFKKSIFFQRRIGFNTIISQRTIRYLISEDKKKSY
jgi:hypothetical protein